MFTGIIREMGTVAQAKVTTAGMALAVNTLTVAELSEMGDSVAVNGACLTITRLDGKMFHADVTRETLSKTTLGSLRTGDKVNLEPALAEYLVPKGSVAVDGVSLTLTEVDEAEFHVSLIPHTLDVTTLGTRSVGDKVNLEADVIGKHIYQYTATRGNGVTLDLLRRTGFIQD